METDNIAPGNRDREQTRLIQAMMDIMITQASIGFGYLDRDLRFVFVNQELARINGIPSAEHIGKSIGDTVPSLMPSIEKVIHKVLVTGKPVKNRKFIGKTAADRKRKDIGTQVTIRSMKRTQLSASLSLLKKSHGVKKPRKCLLKAIKNTGRLWKTLIVLSSGGEEMARSHL